jgi:WD40 repeat protein/tRNA A-37 threonylcarbamoyl transferase component Bud32
MSELIGKDLGPFHIMEQIGAGGMATVYKAYHAAMDRYVAVKVLPEQMYATPELRRRFEREAKVVAGLEHVHILPVHDYGEAGNRLYLVMRYIKAGTLQNRIAAGPMDLTEANRIFQQVASALDYAHRLGIVHRDVKPSNVLLDDEGNCYLTDFGLAKILESSVQLTGSGVGVGTPAYMSPEQGQGEKADARSDIYALGVVLYEMIAGQAPYRAETPMAVVLMHITAPLPPLRSVRPDAPEEVERVIMKAMAKDPDDRFQTVRDMMDALNVAVEVAQAGPAIERLPAAAPVLPKQAVPPAPAGQAMAPVQLRQAAAPVAAQAPASVAPRKGISKWIWLAVGAVGVSVVCLIALAVTLSLLPFRVQLRDGQVQVVRRAAATLTVGATAAATAPVQVWLTTPLDTATPTMPQPTATAIPSQAASTQAVAAAPTATLAPTTAPTMAPATGPTTAPTKAPATGPTAAPTGKPSPIPTVAVHLGVKLVAVREHAAQEVAWSPDGRLLAVAASDLMVYDTQTWDPIYTFSGVSWARGLAFSPDGTLLAGAGHEGVKVWATDGWGQVLALPGSQNADSVAFSPDGTLLAAANSGAVKVWDVATGSEQHTLPGSSGRALAFSPDGRLLAASGGSAGQELVVWEVASGSGLATLTGHTNWINSLAFSPDGRLLASGAVDGTVRLWDVAQGRQVRLLSGHHEQVTGVAFSPDGTLLASVSWDLTVKLWDVTSGQEVASLTGHSGWIESVAFAPGGEMFVSGSDDQMRVWQFEKLAAAPEPTPTLGVSAPIATPIPLSPAAISVDNANRVTSLAILDESNAKQVAWSPDGSLLAIAASNLCIYDAHTRQPIYTMNDVSWAGGLAFSADGSMLAAAAYDGIRVWATDGWGELYTLPGSRGAESVAISPDGTLLIAGSGSALKVWSLEDGSELRTIPAGGPVRPVAFAPDGQTIAAAAGVAGSDVLVWALQSGELLHTFEGHTNWIHSLAFSPDGKSLASASVDGTVRLWDLAAGRQARVLTGHTGQVESVAFSPDGRLLASSSWDLTIRLWEAASGKELAVLTGHTGWVTCVAFAPDGATLASSADTVRLWGIAP